MGIAIAIIVSIILIALIRKGNKEEEQTSSRKSDKQVRYTYELGSPANKRTFRIAGLTYRCTRKDIGIVMGKVGYDRTNDSDPNAIAIIADIELPSERLLGFIPRDSQYSFRNFAKDEQELPFIGYIEEFRDENGEWKIFGKIRVYKGELSDVEADMREDLAALQDAFEEKTYSNRMDLLELW